MPNATPNNPMPTKGAYDSNVANFQIADELSHVGSGIRWVTMDSTKNDATTVSNSSNMSKADQDAFSQAAKNGKGAQGGSGFYFKDPTSGKVHKADTITGTYRLQEITQRVQNIVQSSLSGDKIRKTLEGKVQKLEQYTIR